MIKRIALILLFPIALAACDALPNEVATKVHDAILKGCAFRTDYSWLLDVVTKADVTIQAADQFAEHICTRYQIAKGETGTGALGLMQSCPNGSIEIDGSSVCIEGEPVENPTPKEE